MSRFNEPSSSSDEDDMLEALKEATDLQFLKESLFSNKNETEQESRNEKIGLPKSLRRTFEPVDESNDFGVTKDFKNFVAKQLAKSLDRYIEETKDDKNELDKFVKQKLNKNDLNGIKLMSDSKVNIVNVENIEEDNIEHNRRQRKKLKGKDDSAESVSKCKEVAVEPDWILSKASTAFWAHKQKGTVYKYKTSKDGALVEINEFKNWENNSIKFL